MFLSQHLEQVGGGPETEKLLAQDSEHISKCEVADKAPSRSEHDPSFNPPNIKDIAKPRDERIGTIHAAKVLVVLNYKLDSPLLQGMNMQVG